jgi:hypothetical protein
MPERVETRGKWNGACIAKKRDITRICVGYSIPISDQNELMIETRWRRPRESFLQKNLESEKKGFLSVRDESQEKKGGVSGSSEIDRLDRLEAMLASLLSQQASGSGNKSLQSPIIKTSSPIAKPNQKIILKPNLCTSKVRIEKSRFDHRTFNKIYTAKL